MIKDHVATSLAMSTEDFDYVPFSELGGWGERGTCSGRISVAFSMS
jgi:hypothetical protein